LNGTFCCWPLVMNARQMPAVYSGRKVSGSPPRSTKLYICFITTSDVSPEVRANTSVVSNTGVAISR
jgi:hypothetical protein